MSREIVVETRLPHRLAGNGCPTVVAPGADSSQETFRVLDGDDPDDFALWSAIWHSWTEREVFAHPCYARLFAGELGKPRCGCWSDGSRTVLYPFILRDISKEAYWREYLGPATDIVSPYGYGGPFLVNSDNSPSLATEYWSRFDVWAKEQNVVSEFVRFTLFADSVLEYPSTVKTIRNNVVRDLRLDEDSLWMDFKHKVRKNVKKARRSGVEVELDLEGARLEDFLRIYRDTLTRRGARDAYFFPGSFFEQLQETLAGQFAYFHAVQGGAVVSTELVLVSARSVYSFLGGTDQEAYDLRPNDLLKYEIMQWAKSEGKESLVLGGGYDPEDGIYRHKLAFAPNGAVPFRVGYRTFDDQTSLGLTGARTRHELRLGTAWQPEGDYFPAYRSATRVSESGASATCRCP